MVLFAAAGCGQAGTAAPSTSTAPGAGDSLTAADIDGWRPPDEPPAGWGSVSAKVESLRASADDRKLVLDVAVSPVRLADRTCGAGPPYGEVTDEGHPDVVWASARVVLPNVGPDEALPEWAEEFGDCPTLDTALELEIGPTLAGRDVVIDHVRWVSDSDGDFQICELPACDPESGQEPAAATCDGSSLAQDVRQYGDVGRHASIGESRCQDGWAMVEVDVGGGACPADEGANPCAGERIDRLFLQAGVPHWEVLTRTREAGCGPVLEVAADFPTALCEDRPAL